MPLNTKDKLAKISPATRSGVSSSKEGGNKKFESDAVQFLYDRYVGDDPEHVDAFEEEVFNAAIARQILALRTKAGLSQRELAKRIGTSASAICRLEDADYDGHSLSLLKRIAAALDQRIEIRFFPLAGFRST